MATTDDHPEYDEEEERAPAKEVYHTLLRTLEYNTGGRQPPLHRQAPLRQMVGRERYKPEWVKNAVEKARQNEEIFRWRDDEGTAYLGLDDPDVLREKVASYAQRRDEPRKDLISVANQRIEFHK